MTEFKFIRSFGRVKGRKLTSDKLDLFDNIFPQYQLDLQKLINNIKFNKINLEIGFGSGDFIFYNALNNPNQLFIACEVYLNSMTKLLAKLKENPLNNIIIYKNDVRFLLEELPQNFLDQIFILFPDPWPKKRHHNRRIINHNLLKMLSHITKPQGKLLIATDHPSYQEYLLQLLSNNQFFTLDPNFQQNCHLEPKF